MNDQFKQTYQLLLDELKSWFEMSVRALPAIIVALIVLLIFLSIAKLVKSASEQLIARISDNRAVTKILGTIVYIGVVLAGLFIALGILDLDKTVTSLLAGAGVIGLVLGFAFQELSANFISGIFIAFRKPFGVDDFIQSGDHAGRVQFINLRATVLRTLYGQDVYIPNKQLLTEPVVNYTIDPRRLIELKVGVSYSENLREVETTIYECLREFEGCDYPKETKVYFTSFGDSSIDLVVRYWINFPGPENLYRSTHNAVLKIKEAFDAKGITIPFPIRTVDLGLAKDMIEAGHFKG